MRIRARGNVDYIDDKVRQRFYASTAPALAGNNGRYIESGYSETLFNGEVLALFDRRFTPDWTFSATVGASLNDRTVIRCASIRRPRRSITPMCSTWPISS